MGERVRQMEGIERKRERNGISNMKIMPFLLIVRNWTSKCACFEIMCAELSHIKSHSQRLISLFIYLFCSFFICRFTISLFLLLLVVIFSPNKFLFNISFDIMRRTKQTVCIVPFRGNILQDFIPGKIWNG